MRISNTERKLNDAVIRLNELTGCNIRYETEGAPNIPHWYISTVTGGRMLYLTVGENDKRVRMAMKPMSLEDALKMTLSYHTTTPEVLAMMVQQWA